MSSFARGYAVVGLIAGKWVEVGRPVDFVGDANYFYHRLSGTIVSDVENEDNILLKVQESADGITWSDVADIAAAVTPAPLVPGGRVRFDENNNENRIRLIAFSDSGGRVIVNYEHPIEQNTTEIIEPGIGEDGLVGVSYSD